MTEQVSRLRISLDPLIAEAKRRMRRRRLLLLTGVLVLGAAATVFALRPTGRPGTPLSPRPSTLSQQSISLGSRGPVVAAWQRVLNEWLTPPMAGDRWRRAAYASAGSHIPVDGIFGRATLVATRYWQRDAYQKATGVVTPRVWTLWVGANVTCCGAGLPDFTPQTLHGFGLRPVGSVGWWQHALNLWRAKQGLAPIVVDGVYNAQTRAATGTFQRSVGLAATGVANAATWLKAQRMNLLHL